MKTTLQTALFLALGLSLVSCSGTQKTTAEYDDIYYSPSTETAVAKPAPVALQQTTNTEREMDDYEKYIASLENGTFMPAEYANEAPQSYQDTMPYAADPQYVESESYTEDGKTYVTNNYYNSDDYQYATQIRRFYNPMYSVGYYDPWYCDPYWYSPGWSFNMSFGYPYWGFGFSYGYPYYSYYSPYFYDPYYSWGYYPYYGSSYWHGYHHGYYDGYYYGSGGYYGNDYYPDHRPVYYGPRRSVESGRTMASAGIAGAARTATTAYGRRTTDGSYQAGTQQLTSQGDRRTGNTVSSAARTKTAATGSEYRRTSLYNNGNAALDNTRRPSTSSTSATQRSYSTTFNRTSTQGNSANSPAARRSASESVNTSPQSRPVYTRPTTNQNQSRPSYSRPSTSTGSAYTRPSTGSSGNRPSTGSSSYSRPNSSSSGYSRPSSSPSYSRPSSSSGSSYSRPSSSSSSYSRPSSSSSSSYSRPSSSSSSYSSGSRSGSSSYSGGHSSSGSSSRSSSSGSGSRR